MRFVSIFTLIVALSAASALSDATQAAFRRSFPAIKMQSPKKAITEVIVQKEDVRYCGNYQSECMVTPFISSQTDMTILGMMHKDPIYLKQAAIMYLGGACEEAMKLQLLTVSGYLNPPNSIEKKMDILFDKVTTVFFVESAIAAYKCKEPLVVNKEYDITTLDCKTDQGEDPFAEMKALIGQTVSQDFVFAEKFIELINGGGETLHLDRVNDEGCTCSEIVKKTTKAVMKPFMAPTPSKTVRSIIGDTLKTCGTFAGECEVDDIQTQKSEVVIMGMMRMDPIYMTSFSTAYMGKECNDELRMMKIGMGGLLTLKNDVKKDMILTVDKAILTIHNEIMIQILICEEKLELNVEYDVMKLHCKDASGEDPLIFLQSMIGQEMEAPLVFGDNYLIMGEQRAERVSDEGCTCMRKKCLRDE